ncbi:MAG: hypothetical protein KDA84_28510, partial [Planctomycetaceae bacterium]|nr:hypothetical protein [Planctomycetaceae bacterium]
AAGDLWFCVNGEKIAKAFDNDWKNSGNGRSTFTLCGTLPLELARQLWNENIILVDGYNIERCTSRRFKQVCTLSPEEEKWIHRDYILSKGPKGVQHSLSAVSYLTFWDRSGRVYDFETKEFRRLSECREPWLISDIELMEPELFSQEFKVEWWVHFSVLNEIPADAPLSESLVIRHEQNGESPNVATDQKHYVWRFEDLLAYENRIAPTLFASVPASPDVHLFGVAVEITDPNAGTPTPPYDGHRVIDFEDGNFKPFSHAINPYLLAGKAHGFHLDMTVANAEGGEIIDLSPFIQRTATLTPFEESLPRIRFQLSKRGDFFDRQVISIPNWAHYDDCRLRQIDPPPEQPPFDLSRIPGAVESSLSELNATLNIIDGSLPEMGSTAVISVRETLANLALHLENLQGHLFHFVVVVGGLSARIGGRVISGKTLCIGVAFPRRRIAFQCPA